MALAVCAISMAPVMLSACASDQARSKRAKSSPAPATQEESKLEETGKKAGEIATQPVRDVGIAKTGIPPVLLSANEDPYELQSVRTCEQIVAAVNELNEVLGPDFGTGNALRENRAGKLAEAGGKTIVNTIIPFRGLVREITGAGPAQRRLNAAVDAGYARRGFLRGVHQTRGCRNPLERP